MELYTGSAISTLPLQRYKEMFADTPLVYTKAILKSYSGEKMKPEGKLLVRVEHNNQVKNFTLRKDELTLQDGCLLWGSRVIIPPKYRTQLLEQLHEGHPGIVRMKALARSYIWWPGMDKEVEQTAKGCTGCQLTQKNPKTAPLHTWEWPARPWQRIHIDFSGPFLGTMFLIVVDSHSKWPEVIAMTTTNAARTIEELRKLFATNGLPEQLTFKQALRAALAEKKNLSWKLTNFLLACRTIPHALTGEAPAVVLMGRNLRTKLDILKPNIRKRGEEKQQDQGLRSSHNPTSQFPVGQAVVARNYRTGDKWVPGIITAHLGLLSYEVRDGPNTVRRRHIDQLKETAVTPSVNKEYYTPHLDLAVLVGIPLATCGVGSEEPQPPSANDMEKLPTINIDVTNQPTNSPSSQN
ncbi:Uncharacterized protein K02A2.6 [Stylophora pistillata]|uniref:Uncharacterized protein K02A2.6 n=1 Tax=Stylophora pistillata TaxID=50429 RepID=A0A2B4R608_STYPI|nr:Uncharacterized protein K02A2.6 [Stylophora pistillata]